MTSWFSVTCVRYEQVAHLLSFYTINYNKSSSHTVVQLAGTVKYTDSLSEED